MLQFFEFYRTFRTIWTGGRVLPRPDDVEPRWLGYAVGRWEGNTFIVESTGYSDRPCVTELAYPQSDQLRVTERYRRTTTTRWRSK